MGHNGMSDVKFDLQEALAESIIKGTGLPIKIAYLAPDNSIGLVPEQGSHKISTDFSGREYWVYNYAITERGKSSRDIKNDLFKISMYLDDLELGAIKSDDNTFTFDKIDVSSAPSETEQDLQGTVTYLLDVAVFVYTK